MINIYTELTFEELEERYDAGLLSISDKELIAVLFDKIYTNLDTISDTIENDYNREVSNLEDEVDDLNGQLSDAKELIKKLNKKLERIGDITSEFD